MTGSLEASTALFQDVAERVEHVLRVNDYKPNACIAAAYITKEVLAPLGFDVQPLPCKVQVWNYRWSQFVKTTGRLPTKDETDADDQLWSVGCGIGRDEADVRNNTFGLHQDFGYIGHIVSLVNRDYIIDPTLGQVTRPKKGIDMGPAALRVRGSRAERRAFFHGTGFMIYTQDCEKPSTLLYLAKPKDKSFMRAPDWSGQRNTTDYRLLAQAVREAL